jgi:hypothetical protein
MNLKSKSEDPNANDVIMANSIFSEKEVEYIKSQHIARIATASIASQEEEEEEEEGLYEPLYR